VLKDSPAQKAGLKPFVRGQDGNVIVGDIIVALAGKPVTSLDDLLSLLEQHQPGETVPMTILRDGQKVEQPVTLGLPE